MTSSSVLFVYTAGSDYQSTTITVTFEPSDESTEAKCGTVTIIDDMVAGEPNEQFSVSLVSADPTGTFGNRETCVTIVDDDNGKMRLLAILRTVELQGLTLA